MATGIYLEANSFEVDVFESAVIESKLSTELIVRGPGTWYKFPWSKVHIYSMKIVALRNEIEVLDKDSYPINITIVSRFSPILEKLGKLHTEIGQQYSSDFVAPYVISNTKIIAVNYTAEELWLTKRLEFETSLNDLVARELSKNHIDLKSLLVISIKIPAELEKIIRQKHEPEEVYQEIN